jgi:tryptophan synthase beta chain
VKIGYDHDLIAYVMKLAKELDQEDSIIVNLSGRGDKDVEQVYKMIQSK